MSSPPIPSAPGAAPPRLQLAGITKRYPAVVANSGVSLTVQPGEIHAVLGENGAGKSTLMKIIYGTVRPDEGGVQFDGRPVSIRNPQEARQLGIAMVFQHFSLFDTLTVAENVWLGLDKSQTLAEVTSRITAKAAEYGLDIDPLRPVHTLSVGEMQRVEIIRALLTAPKVLILDEPTSVLTPQAVEKLFVVLRKLASEGCSILYISHKLHEIRALCTACTVLRGGMTLTHVSPAFLDEQQVGLPIWVPSKDNPYAGYGAVSNERAIAAGLTFRPLATTVQDLLAWFHSLPAERQAKLGAGITREKEAELLKAWHARKG